jgi:hypothetical protein
MFLCTQCIARENLEGADLSFIEQVEGPPDDWGASEEFLVCEGTVFALAKHFFDLSFELGGAQFGEVGTHAEIIGQFRWFFKGFASIEFLARHFRNNF